MRRDMDTVRRILRTVGDAKGPVPVSALTTSEDDARKVYEHVAMMVEGGLLSASRAGVNYTRVERLTWDGQDMLAAIENEKVWDRVKSTIATVGGDCAFATIKALAVQAGAAALGLS